MTLEEIKSEMSERLREVRADANDFSNTKSYDDLSRLIIKAISRVALCESSSDLEATDDLLSAIEDCWNDCKSELNGEPSNDSLFDFNFELDFEEKQEVQEEISDENEDEKSDGSKDDPKKRSTDKRDRFREAKISFYEKYPLNAQKKLNVFRFMLGGTLLFSGIGYGVVDAIANDRYIFAWHRLTWIAVGLGASLLILSLLYAVSFIAKGSAARQFYGSRLILAFVTAAAAIALGLSYEGIGLDGACLITLPFTLGGASSYVYYRVKLSFIAKKVKKRKK